MEENKSQPTGSKPRSGFTLKTQESFTISHNTELVGSGSR